MLKAGLGMMREWIFCSYPLYSRMDTEFIKFEAHVILVNRVFKFYLPTILIHFGQPSGPTNESICFNRIKGKGYKLTVQ